MDKWDFAEKILIIGGIWAIIIWILYAIAGNEASELGATAGTHSEITGMLFGIYLGQTVQFVYYFMMPILLFFIAWSLLKKDEKIPVKEPEVRPPEKRVLIRTITKGKRTQKD